MLRSALYFFNIGYFFSHLATKVINCSYPNKDSISLFSKAKTSLSSSANCGLSLCETQFTICHLRWATQNWWDAWGKAAQTAFSIPWSASDTTKSIRATPRSFNASSSSFHHTVPHQGDCQHLTPPGFHLPIPLKWHDKSLWKLACPCGWQYWHWYRLPNNEKKAGGWAIGQHLHGNRYLNGVSLTK